MLTIADSGFLPITRIIGSYWMSEMELAEDFRKRAKELEAQGQNNKGNSNRKKLDSQSV